MSYSGFFELVPALYDQVFRGQECQEYEMKNGRIKVTLLNDEKVYAPAVTSSGSLEVVFQVGKVQEFLTEVSLYAKKTPEERHLLKSVFTHLCTGSLEKKTFDYQKVCQLTVRFWKGEDEKLQSEVVCESVEDKNVKKNLLCLVNEFLKTPKTLEYFGFDEKK